MKKVLSTITNILFATLMVGSNACVAPSAQQQINTDRQIEYS
ncbi:MAG: hypothetical protein ABIC91_08405 [Nanoarchaeota archaeon]